MTELKLLAERGSSPGGHLAISVDQLVALLFAKYVRDVATART
jgi:hypothetical protein